MRLVAKLDPGNQCNHFFGIGLPVSTGGRSILGFRVPLPLFQQMKPFCSSFAIAASALRQFNAVRWLMASRDHVLVRLSGPVPAARIRYAAATSGSPRRHTFAKVGRSMMKRWPRFYGRLTRLSASEEASCD